MRGGWLGLGNKSIDKAAGDAATAAIRRKILPIFSGDLVKGSKFVFPAACCITGRFRRWGRRRCWRLEPPHLRVTLVEIDRPVEDLLPIALTYRPELAGQQALVQATVERLKREKYRPLLPTVLLRGASTSPAGTLAGGYFGGGLNGHLSNFNARSDFELQVPSTVLDGDRPAERSALAPDLPAAAIGR
jgi:hypothetical protein